MMRRFCLSITVMMLLYVAWGPIGAALVERPERGLRLQQVPLDDEFMLTVGQRIETGVDVLGRLVFEEVREDSRCPLDMTCIWAGDAVVSISVDGPSSTVDGPDGSTTVELHTHPSYPTEAAVGQHVVRLVELSPVPREDATIEASQYEATLVVTRRSLAP